MKVSKPANRDRSDGARRRVVAELEFVHRAVAEQSLQVEHGVRRVRRDLQPPSRDAVRGVTRAAVAEDPHVGGPFAGHLDVEPAAEGVLRDLLGVLELRDVEIGVGRGTRENHRARREESGPQAGHRRDGAGPGGRARHRLDEVLPGVEPVAFVAGEEERPVFHDRPANRSAKLILAQRRFRQHRSHAAIEIARRVEVVRRIELVIPEIFEDGAVHSVGARLGDDAHLAARARSVFRGIAARFDAELLDVLEAGLQLERGVGLAVHVARRRVDDRGPFDAVILDDVLLVGAAAEADVLPGAGAGVLRAWRLEHQLRHLPPIDRQFRHVALADVHAELRRAHVEDRRRADDGHGLLNPGRLELEVEVQLLADVHLHLGVLNRREPILLGANRVRGRLERRDEEVPFLVAQDGAFFPGPLVLHFDLRARDEGVRLVANRSGKAALVSLRHCRGRGHHCDCDRRPPRAKSHQSSHSPAPAGPLLSQEG